MGSDEMKRLSHAGMSTVMTHMAHGGRAEEALAAAKAEAERLEGLMSRYLPDSEISHLNAAAGSQAVAVGQENFEVLKRAKEFARIDAGLFDVTVGPLVDLWRAAKQKGETPTDAEIARAIGLVDSNDLLLDEAEWTVMLRRPGQSVDLGGIAKGYAADRFLDVFREHGVTSALTNIGGNVAALGAKPDGSPWRVGIQHPRSEGALIGLIESTGGSVVTSGDYQRFFMDSSGIRRHHILDPRTGKPAESGVVSATVATASSMDADALSTMLFVAGMERSAELLAQFPGAEAVLIDSGLRIFVSAGLEASFRAAEGYGVKELK